MMRLSHVAKLTAALSCALIAVSLPAQKITPARRAEHIAQVNAIDIEGMKPWHLKLGYELFDSKGNSESQGTLEKWWAGPERWRVVLTQNGGTPLTIVSVDDDIYRSDQAGFLPSRIELLLHQIEHPVSAAEVKSSTPEVRPMDFGKLKTYCVMLAETVKGVHEIPLGLFPTYCVGDDDVVRVSWLYAGVVVANDRTGTFQEHRVPVKVHALVDQVQSFAGNVQTLATVSLTEVDLSTQGLTKEVLDHPSRIGSGVMAGLKTGGKTPYYPVEARMNHVSGTVVIRAVIGKDGYIHSLHISSSPDGSLSIAALAAVRSWTYKPYLLNGVPTEVDTTITVNFNLN